MNHQTIQEQVVILPGQGPNGGWYWYFKKHDTMTHGPFKIKALAWKDVHNTIGKAGNGTVTISPNSNPIP
jgi:hypothetical protein